MLDSEIYISDQPLPEALNFEALRSNGIKQLQAMVGEVWTNYNESDPGITILDQLCYGLTELAYCVQFSIEDLLTGQDGEINYHDQFFTPQDILTCSPVTLDDYRKLVLDAIPEVRVIYIEPVTSPEQDDDEDTVFTGYYNSYLSLKGSCADERGNESGDGGGKEEQETIRCVHELLNQHRNLGELFLPPHQLVPKEIELGGKIVLAQTADVVKVRAQIQEALLNYAAPLVVQSGYSELLSQGVAADQIFNGPKLGHGWIAGQNALKEKRDCVSLCSLTTLMAGIEGVLAVEGLKFTSAPGQTEIKIQKAEIPKIRLSASGFQVGDSGTSREQLRNQLGHQLLVELSTKHQAASLPSEVDLYPDLPKGKYRNVEEYYSVQNTFPDIYGIGHNSLRSGASSHRVAASRQLKGYLMHFDQLLANEFSQLAHLGELFSFRPHQYDPAQSGIPHNKFVTTYYCQPLYDIPDVKPLLLGNDAFHYQYGSDKTDKEIEEKAWRKFRKFQFNEYIHGLRQIMESNAEAATRRDVMLSHLMARHGDDASRYDEMIDTCQWFGGKFKTRIIAKNIWLQNYQLLSYNRTRAFDIYASAKLPLPGDTSIVGEMESRYEGRTGKRLPWWKIPNYPVIDGEVDQARIYADAVLGNTDLHRFSAFELKAGILLGLPLRLQALAGKLQALLEDTGFLQWLEEQAKAGPIYSLRDSGITVRRRADSSGQLRDQLFEGEQCLMDIAPAPSSALPAQADYLAHVHQLLWLSTQSKGFLLLESNLLLWGQDPCLPAMLKHSAYFLKAYLLFPGYITLFQQPKFLEFIETLQDFHWPAHVMVSKQIKSFHAMEQIIQAYVRRNNNFRHPEILEESSSELANQLQLPQAGAAGTGGQS